MPSQLLKLAPLLLGLLLAAAGAGADDAGERQFAAFAAAPGDYQAVAAYTLDLASDDDCGINYVHYGTRALLDFDITEITSDGTEKVGHVSPSARPVLHAAAFPRAVAH